MIYKEPEGRKSRVDTLSCTTKVKCINRSTRRAREEALVSFRFLKLTETRAVIRKLAHEIFILLQREKDTRDSQS